jgi:outer membrane protein assembly factor BamB
MLNEASPPGGTDWPLFRGDALATGVAKSSLAEDPQVLWKFSAGKNGFQATAVIAGSVVYVGSLDGNFYSIDLQAGTEKWHFHTELGFVASAAVRDNSIYAGDSDGKFYCLDGATGKPKWTFETGAEINSAPNFYQDSVLFGSQDATLYCLNRSSGTLVWKYTIGDQIRCSPTVVENRAFIAGCDGKLHIVDLDKGESAGSVMIDAPTGSTPGVLEDRVFFGTEGPTFYAIDWRNARIDWTFKPEKAMPFRSSAAVTSGTVVFGGQDKQVHALDLGGHELWKFSTRGRVDSSPVIVGERVFVGSADGRLYACQNGRKRIVELIQAVGADAELDAGSFDGAEVGAGKVSLAEMHEVRAEADRFAPIVVDDELTAVRRIKFERLRDLGFDRGR